MSCHFSLCSVTNTNSCPILRRSLNNKTAICLEEPPVTEGEIYIFIVTATNVVDLSSTSKSTHFVIDTTEPDVGEIITSNPLGKEYSLISSSVLARWNGFSDKESGIADYHVCIGKEPGLCDIEESVSVGKTSQYTWYNLSLVSTEKYFVSIRSVNNAGLFTDYVASDPFTADTTGICSCVETVGKYFNIDSIAHLIPMLLSDLKYKYSKKSEYRRLKWTKSI